MCVFHKKEYIRLLTLLLTSISLKSKIDTTTTDILILTSPEFQPMIEEEASGFGFKLQYYTLDLHTLMEAGCARLNIFQYANISKYDTILYLDTDVLVHSDVNVLWNLDISSEKLYALEEATIQHPFWGGRRFFQFSKHPNHTTAFSSGVLLFRNSDTMKNLFATIQSHIVDDITVKKNPIPKCLDQPYIVYNAIVQKKYDNQLLKEYVENNPTETQSKKIVYHFPGFPGLYSSKYEKMTMFWEKMYKESPSNV